MQSRCRRAARSRRPAAQPWLPAPAATPPPPQPPRHLQGAVCPGPHRSAHLRIAGAALLVGQRSAASSALRAARCREGDPRQCCPFFQLVGLLPPCRRCCWSSVCATAGPWRAAAAAAAAGRAAHCRHWSRAAAAAAAVGRRKRLCHTQRWSAAAPARLSCGVVEQGWARPQAQRWARQAFGEPCWRRPAAQPLATAAHSARSACWIPRHRDLLYSLSVLDITAAPIY